MRPRHIEAHKCNAEAPHRGLTFGADVEQSRVISHGDGEAGEDKVGGVVEGVTDAVGTPERALHHGFDCHHRVLANGHNHQSGQ